MLERTTKVLLVRGEGWGLRADNPDKYDKEIEMFAYLLSRAKRSANSASVESVETFKEAKERVSKGDINVLVFISRSMIPEAREIKKANRKLKVIVLTGLIPDDEIIIISKLWINRNLVESLVFN